MDDIGLDPARGAIAPTKIHPARRRQPAQSDQSSVRFLSPRSANSPNAAGALFGQVPISSTASAPRREPSRRPASLTRSLMVSLSNHRRPLPLCHPDSGRPLRRGSGGTAQIINRGSWGNSIHCIKRRWCHNLAARPIASAEGMGSGRARRAAAAGARCCLERRDVANRANQHRRGSSGRWH